MAKLSLKEKVFFRLICNERRIYRHWYRRYLNAGVDLDRTRRVVSRVRSWYDWCREWSYEGELLEKMARTARSAGNLESAKRLFHEAAGCFHVGQHFFHIDVVQKQRAEDKLRSCYRSAIELYADDDRPIRLDIPFRDTKIPGYLRHTAQPHSPLVIFVNGMDNLKEAELHHYGDYFIAAGFNTLAFDGPGQGEMWRSMKLIPDYERCVSAIIDWLENHDDKDVDLERIALVGWSLGGYLAPRAAAFDERIRCAIGSGGPAHTRWAKNKLRVNPFLLKGIPHIVGASSYEEALPLFDLDIRTAPPLDRPLLIFHSGNDKLIPNGRSHGEIFMDWAVGEKELKFYPDGEHVCANYLDETDAYMIDWLRKHL